MKSHQRRFIVLASLASVLTLTSALLIALAPPPISAGSAYDNLWAADGEGSHELVDALFKTQAPIHQGRWKYIYIHQSATASGNVSSQARGDHFLIGNGNGSPDGQIEMTQRWNNQTSPAPASGASTIDRACISICVVGDFNAAAPTANEVRRLTELVSALQGQLGIGNDAVCVIDDASAAGIGSHFPSATFRQQILP